MCWLIFYASPSRALGIDIGLLYLGENREFLLGRSSGINLNENMETFLKVWTRGHPESENKESDQRGQVLTSYFWSWPQEKGRPFRIGSKIHISIILSVHSWHLWFNSRQNRRNSWRSKCWWCAKVEEVLNKVGKSSTREGWDPEGTEPKAESRGVPRGCNA